MLKFQFNAELIGKYLLLLLSLNTPVFSKTETTSPANSNKKILTKKKYTNSNTNTKPRTHTKPLNTLKNRSTAKATSTIKIPIKPITKITPQEAGIIDPSGKPIWLDLRSATKANKSLNRMYLADIYTDWCGWCKKLDHDTFHDSKVETFIAQNFVCMRINAEDSGSGQELAQKYKISGYPCIMVFDKNNNLIAQNMGYLSPQQLLDWLHFIMQKNNNK